MKIRYSLVTVLVLVLLITAPTMAQGPGSMGIAPERLDLFVASQRMLAEERSQSTLKAGMVLTTLGEDSEISAGVRVETSLTHELPISLLTEAIYLRKEQALAGFISLKFTPFTHIPFPVYVGGGAGYADGFRYQAFVGFELSKNIFAEARYVNMTGGIGDRGLHLAAGFQFTF